MAVTKEKIVEASIILLNRDGLDGLTMRTLAKELDIKAASLYWHIKDKQQLYGMIAEHVCMQIKMSAELSDPKKYLYELNTKYRAKLQGIKDSVEIFLHSQPDTPCRAELLSNTLDCLANIGVKRENCLTAANMLNNYVLSFVADEIHARTVSAEESETKKDRFGSWRKKSMFHFEAQFLYGLEVLFAGFKAISPSK